MKVRAVDCESTQLLSRLVGRPHRPWCSIRLATAETSKKTITSRGSRRHPCHLPRAISLSSVVAELGIAPRTSGNEPDEILLLYPAIRVGLSADAEVQRLSFALSPAGRTGPSNLREHPVRPPKWRSKFPATDIVYRSHGIRSTRFVCFWFAQQSRQLR
jgi:hypothetical protein